MMIKLGGGSISVCRPNNHPWYIAGRRDRTALSSTTTTSPSDTLLMEDENTDADFFDGIAEFHCAARKSERSLLHLDGSSKLNNNNPSSHFTDYAALERNKLLEFKRHTSWMFDKWYDWGGQCDADPRNDGILRGAHSSRDSLYRLENFCLRPMGKLSGFAGSSSKVNADFRKMSPYYGTHEAFKVPGASHKTGESGMAEFLSDVYKLPSKQRCYLDTKVVLFPITIYSANVGHSLHRSGSMLRILEHAFSSSSPPHTSSRNDNITVIYVVTSKGESVVKTPEANEKANAWRYFYDVPGVAGTSWAAIWGKAPHELFPATADSHHHHHRPKEYSAAEKMDERSWADELLLLRGVLANNNNNSKNSRRRVSFGKYTTTKALTAPICFRHGVVWQNAHFRLASKVRFAAANAAGKRTSYQLFGDRSRYDAETLNLLNDKIRKCLKNNESKKTKKKEKTTKWIPNSLLKNNNNLQQQQTLHNQAARRRRDKVNRKTPHVIFAVRSNSRRFSLQPHLINVIADFVSSSELRGTFEVIEHIHLDFDEIIERFSRADILIGMLGAGLIWTELMPPGAILIELNAPNYRCATKSGINKNPTCDFGGAAAAAQQYHVAFPLQSDALLRHRVDEKESVLGVRYEKLGAGATDLAVGASTVKFVLEKASCVLKYSMDVVVPSVGATSSSSSSSTTSTLNPVSDFLLPVPRQCQFGAAEVFAVENEDIKDADGASLLASVAMSLQHLGLSISSGSSMTAPRVAASSPFSSSSSFSSAWSESLRRLHIMMKHRKRLSAALYDFKTRTGSNQISSLRIVLVLRCSIMTFEEGKDESAVFSEVFAWRSIIGNGAYQILVAENSAPEEYCRRKQQNQLSRQQKKPTTNPQRSLPKLTHGVVTCQFRSCRYPKDTNLIVRSIVPMMMATADGDSNTTKKERHDMNEGVMNMLSQHLSKSGGLASIFSFDLEKETFEQYLWKGGLTIPT